MIPVLFILTLLQTSLADKQREMERRIAEAEIPDLKEPPRYLFTANQEWLRIEVPGKSSTYFQKKSITVMAAHSHQSVKGIKVPHVMVQVADKQYRFQTESFKQARAIVTYFLGE